MYMNSPPATLEIAERTEKKYIGKKVSLFSASPVCFTVKT